MTIDVSSRFALLRRLSRAPWMCLVALAPLLAAGCSGSGGEGAVDPPDPGSDARLSSLTISGAAIAFSPDVINYDVAVKFLTQESSITPTAANAAASIEVNGSPAVSSTATLVPLNEGGNTVFVTVTSEDGTAARVYTLFIDREFAAEFAQDAYVKASNTDGNDEFGYSVAIAGDTLAVGARNESSGATGVGGDQGDNTAGLSGAVYVFARTAGAWTQEAFIKASNANELDRFGSAVALDGDTLAVGAPREASSATGVGGDQDDDSAVGSGAVYVFTRSAGTWSQQAYLKASNTDEGDEFGSSLALDGDTLAVGAQREESGATGVGGDQDDDSENRSGAAYVFIRSAGVWTQQAYVKASNTSSSDFFGYSLALDADTLAVGAIEESSDAIGVGGDQNNDLRQNSGAVYVFARVAGAWTQQAYVKASNTGDDDRFGWSVALDGDTLAVGALGEDSSAVGVGGDQDDNSAVSSGAVYVFTRNAGAWTQGAYIKASNTGAGDDFGVSVALDSDTLAVGASRESSSAVGVGGDEGDDSATASGAAYLFTRSAGAWAQQAYVKASSTDGNDNFGSAVAVDGDTLAVGALNESSNATGVGGNDGDNSVGDSGAAYVLR